MGFHWYDIMILLGVALLIFGPKRLPEMGSAVGKTIKEFQRSMKEVSEPEQPPAAVVPPVAPPQLATTVTEDVPTARSESTTTDRQ